MEINIKEKVLQALGTVLDPDLKQDLVSLGMVQSLQVNESHVTFILVLTTPACPLQKYLKKACIKAIHTYVGTHLNVEVKVRAQVTTLRNDGLLLPGVKNIIAVASGKGGVGKSTLATNLAVTLARQGAQVGLLDADIFGPSIPTMFGCEHQRPQVVKKADKQRLLPLERYGVKLLSIALLAPTDGAMVWRGPMASAALKQLLYDTDWGELDYLFIDLPPGTSDVHLTLVQAVSVTGAVIVTTPQKIALIDAAKGVDMFQKASINVPIVGIIENMAYFAAASLPDQRYYLFGKGGGEQLAKLYQIPFLGAVPLLQDIREGGDEGVPAAWHVKLVTTIFGQLASSLAQQIAIRNAQLAPTMRVAIKGS